MDDFDKTLEFLHSLISEDEYGETVLANPGEKEVFCALIQSIPDEVAQEWLSSGRYCEYPMNYYLRGKIEFSKRRNVRSAENLRRPISEVISDFRDMKSGKRTEAKKEMLHRFASLDWKGQLEVFEALVEAASSYKSYRDLVFNTLRTYFWMDLDNIRLRFKSRKVKPLQDKIVKLCTDHINEFYPALFAIKFFDLSFIQTHKEELIEAVDYYSVANRLMENPEFILQRDLLAPPFTSDSFAEEEESPKALKERQIKHYLKCGRAYYSLMAKHRRSVELKDARDLLLLSIIHNEDLQQDAQSSNGSAQTFSLMSNKEMYRLLMDLGRLGFLELIMGYHEMEREVQKKFQEYMAKADPNSYINDIELWNRYLKLFAQEAFSRYYSDEDREKLKDTNRLEYYKNLTDNKLPIDENEARAFLADLVRDAKSLTLDFDMTNYKAENFTLRLNNTINELLIIFEQNGLNDALKGFASFEKEVKCRFNKIHNQIVNNEVESIALWNEFLEMAETELYNREHAQENGKQFFSNNPEMKSLFNDFDLQVVRYDLPI